VKTHKKDLPVLIAALGLLVVSVFVFPKIFPGFGGVAPKKELVEPKFPTQLEVPVLMYHYVEYNQDERDFLRDSLNIVPHVFEAQIETFKDAGYTFITPQELPGLFADSSLAEQSMGQGADQKYVILSFDDGYEDFYTDVLPILKKHNVKAVNYIVSNFIGRLNYMKAWQIEEVIESGLVELGCHTANHWGLPGLEETVAFAEISESKKYLEDEFGVEVTSFAYPYGAYDADVVELVKRAGFTNAVTDDLGVVILRDKLFEIPRVRPGYNVGEDLLGYLEKL